MLLPGQHWQDGELFLKSWKVAHVSKPYPLLLRPEFFKGGKNKMRKLVLNPLNKCILITLSVSTILLVLYSEYAFAKVNCDPSALTYDHQACETKNDVFTLYANNESLEDISDSGQKPVVIKKKIVHPSAKKKDLSKSLDEKLKKLDMSRRAQKKDDLGLHVTSSQNSISSNNRGMETQIEKSHKTQGEPIQIAPTTERKKAFVGVKLPIETSNRK